MFGLFESNRRKGLKAAMAAVTPMVSMIESLGKMGFGPGIPSGMWGDPYILGYVNGTIVSFAKLHTSNKIDSTDIALVACDVYSAITQKDGRIIALIANGLHEDKDPDFMRGADEAITNFMVTHRFMKLDTENDLISRAKKHAAMMGKPNDANAIGAALISESWMKRIRELDAEAKN